MRVSILIFVLSVLGCKTLEHLPFAGEAYLPSAEKLKQGLVWKYYHHQGKVGNGAKTDIRYTKCILVGDTLHHEVYDAGFRKIGSSDLLMTNDNWIAISEKVITYYNTDTLPYQEVAYTIGRNVHTNWSEREAVFEKTIVLNKRGSRFIVEQSNIKDTLINGAEAKIIEGRQIIIPIRDNIEQDTVFLTRRKIYQAGLGLISKVMKSTDNSYKLELDELITLAEFERRANHGMHRVGYIDTLQTMDDYKKFSPCFHPDKINDYYNDRRAQIKGGKGRLRAMLAEKLEESKISNESGYLTYRFVINCRGEAGWFVTEEADLDFRKKQFSDAARTHLFELLTAEKYWVNLQISGVDRDAYTYITFKIDDGKIIELLP